jgi:hypothetical protein
MRDWIAKIAGLGGVVGKRMGDQSLPPAAADKLSYCNHVEFTG